MEEAREGDCQGVLEYLCNWWNSLDIEERAQALSLEKENGWEVAKNALFIDSVDEDGDIDSVIEL
jgi:hypothetical protein